MDNNTFWQVNFWGIVGTTSGALGLFISWLNWRYSKPKIVLAKLELETPRYKSMTNQEKQKEYYEQYTLHIRFRNKKGGSGSIEKPLLIIRFPEGTKFLFFHRYKTFILTPRTQHTEQHKTESSGSYTAYETEVIRHGEAWNFHGGQIIDDELEYVFRGEGFHEVLQNQQLLEYFIEYHNNFGDKYTKNITSIREDN